jgi:hypothetical protein
MSSSFHFCLLSSGVAQPIKISRPRNYLTRFIVQYTAVLMACTPSVSQIKGHMTFKIYPIIKREFQVRAAFHFPEQHPGVDDQRDGLSDRGHLRGDLPHLRGAEGAAADAGPPGHRHLHLRRGGAGLAAGPARHRPQGLLWHGRHHLLHLHVRLAAVHHGKHSVRE